MWIVAYNCRQVIRLAGRSSREKKKKKLDQCCIEPASAALREIKSVLPNTQLAIETWWPDEVGVRLVEGGNTIVKTYCYTQDLLSNTGAMQPEML